MASADGEDHSKARTIIPITQRALVVAVSTFRGQETRTVVARQPRHANDAMLADREASWRDVRFSSEYLCLC